MATNIVSKNYIKVVSNWNKMHIGHIAHLINNANINQMCFLDISLIEKNYFFVSLYQYNWQYVLSTKKQIKSVDKVIVFYQIYSSVFDDIELQTLITGTCFKTQDMLAGKYLHSMLDNLFCMISNVISFTFIACYNKQCTSPEQQTSKV